MGMKSFESWFNDMADSVVDPYAKVADKDNPSANTAFSDKELKESTVKEGNKLQEANMEAVEKFRDDFVATVCVGIGEPIKERPTITFISDKIVSINDTSWISRHSLFYDLVISEFNVKLEYLDGTSVDFGCFKDTKEVYWYTPSITARPKSWIDFCDSMNGAQNVSLKQVIEWIYHEIKK